MKEKTSVALLRKYYKDETFNYLIEKIILDLYDDVNI